MPVHLRNFYFKELVDMKEKEKKEMDKVNKKSKIINKSSKIIEKIFFTVNLQ